MKRWNPGSPSAAVAVAAGAVARPTKSAAASAPSARTARGGELRRRGPRRSHAGVFLRAAPVAQLRQDDARVGDVVEPVLRVPLEAAAQQARGAAAGVEAGSAREVDLPLQHQRQRLGHRIAGEQLPAGQHLVEHDAERPDVRPLVDRAAPACSGAM